MPDRHILTIDEAISVLPDGDYLHTTIANGVPLGADWSRDAVIAHIRKAGSAQISGPIMMGMRHGLCLDAGRRLFVVHDPARMAALEAAIAAEPQPTPQD